MSDTDLGDFLRSQLHLQTNSFGDDPRNLRGEALADYVMWNVTALSDELHEALQEIKWKPWLTTGRGQWVNRDAFLGELVDAFHFLLNLILASAADENGGDMPGDLAHEFALRYQAKRRVNARRQSDGYDGTKDVDGRATDEPVVAYDSMGRRTCCRPVGEYQTVEEAMSRTRGLCCGREFESIMHLAPEDDGEDPTW